MEVEWLFREIGGREMEWLRDRLEDAANLQDGGGAWGWIGKGAAILAMGLRGTSESEEMRNQIRQIRRNASAYRFFRTLLAHNQGNAVWRPDGSGDLRYIGANPNPDIEEVEQRSAVRLFLRLGCIQAARYGDDPPQHDQYYGLSDWGRRIIAAYRQQYPKED